MALARALDSEPPALKLHHGDFLGGCGCRAPGDSVLRMKRQRRSICCGDAASFHEKWLATRDQTWLLEVPRCGLPIAHGDIVSIQRDSYSVGRCETGTTQRKASA